MDKPIPARTENFELEKGTSFVKVFTVKDFDGSPTSISGFSGSAAMARSYISDTSVTFDFGLTGTTGQYYLSMEVNKNSSLTAGRYVYTTTINNGNFTSRAHQGIVTVSPQIIP